MATIERARPADRVAIERVVTAAYSPYIARNGAVPGPMRDDYAAYIEAGYAHILRNDDGVVAGVLVLIPEAETMMLDNVAVDPAAHGKGYGRLLLDHAEAQARAMGFSRIRLYTQVIMTENQAIYAKRGYVETHRIHEKGLHRVYMEKRLD